MLPTRLPTTTADPLYGMQRLLRAAALGGVLVVLLVTTSSAFLRLRALGLGCEDWPACYAQREAAAPASAGPSAARRDGIAGSPCTSAARGLTGRMRPSKPAARRFASTLPPTFEGSRDAPITATLRGAKNEVRLPRPVRTADATAVPDRDEQAGTGRR